MALLETLTDNFDDNSLNTSKWSVDTSGGGTVTEQNQRLEIAGANNGNSAGVNGVTAYDMTGSYAFARVSNWASGTWSTFGVTDPSGDQYYLQIGPVGTMAFWKKIGGSESQIDTNTTYNASTHAWFRIRESGGSIFVDTASNSASNPPAPGDWTNFRSATKDAAFDATAVKALMGHYSAGTNLATHVDGYNTTASAGIAVAALVGTFNTTGSGTVSSGFPLVQGQLTDADFSAGKVVVRDTGGNEVAIFCEALRGRYPDGSIRSVLIQFPYDTGTTPVDFMVEVGGLARTLSDLIKTTQTSALFEAGRYIIPKNVSHSKDCWVTFKPILNAAEETSIHTAHLVDQFINRYETGKNGDITAGNYQANYEPPNSLIARWQAHGSTSYYRDVLWNGLRRGYYLLTNGFLPANGSGLWTPEVNTNFLTCSGSGANPSEWNSHIFRSMATMYLLTGMIEFWNYVCAQASAGTYRNSSASLTADLHDDAAISAAWLPRHNMRRLIAIQCAVVIDATKGFTSSNIGATGRDLGGSAAATELPWYLDAHFIHRYARGDWRDGQLGCYDENTDGENTGGPSGIGTAPNFQFAIAANAYLFWYLNVKADDTTANYIKANVDAVWDNAVGALPVGGSQYNAGARHGYSYWQTVPAYDAGNVEGPMTFPMWADVIAFCKAKYGDQKYSDYLAIAMHEANMEGDVDGTGGSLGGIGDLTWGEASSNWWTFWKLMGEAYAFSTSAPYFDVVGLPTGLPSSIRTPTQY